MKISSVSSCVIEANYDWTIIKVITDEGITGYGEAFFAPGLSSTIREFRPILEGEDPRDIDRLCRKMRTSGMAAGAWGMVHHAVSGIEAALLDILGKKFGIPLYQFLGGKYRSRVRIYADCHGGSGLESLSPVLIPRSPSWAKSEEELTAGRNTRESQAVDLRMKYHGVAGECEIFEPQQYAQRAREMAERGFTALKFDVDVPNPYSLDEYNRALTSREIEYMASLARAAGEAVGDEVEVAIDCHWNFNVNDILRFAWECEDLDLLWLEDPIPPENVSALRQVTQSTRTPIASGENHYGRQQFRDLLEAEALNIAAPDLQKVGGLLEGRRIADLADMHYVNIAPHNISSPIGTMASVHFCAAIPNFLCLEWHAASVPFFDKLVKAGEGPLIQDGYITVPERPGLGIELDEEVAYEYRKRSEAFFE
ncbi:MAG: mandelate racemase/muconate lactonizing enzyme family protein [Acidobacteriota bacterium]